MQSVNNKFFFLFIFTHNHFKRYTMAVSGFTSVPLSHNMLEKFSLTIVDSLQRDNSDVHNCSREHLLKELISLFIRKIKHYCFTNRKMIK